MSTNDETRAAALAKRLLSLVAGEGITQENICAGQELARAYLAQQSELDRLRAEVADMVESLDANWVTHQRVIKAEAENARLLAANAELAMLLSDAIQTAEDRADPPLTSHMFAKHRAALARHDAGKGSGK